MSHTIVIAEDNPLIASFISEALSDEGFIVQHYSDGRAALDAVIAHPPALLLLDLNLPIMHGEQVLASIRNQLGMGLPIIIMTASRPQVASRLSSANGFLAKPFGLNDLLACVAQYVARGE
jgi:DNA-binding response OmpR family regulator